MKSGGQEVPPPSQDSVSPEAVGRAMYARDAAARMLGIQLEEIGPGHARMTMPVRDDMVNGHGTCHGGLTFTLADTAFAYACNSYNQSTVAQAAQISFLAPARAGDKLTAEAVERTRKGKTGVYDISVHNQDGELIALFRGNSHSIKGEIVTTLASAGG